MVAHCPSLEEFGGLQLSRGLWEGWVASRFQLEHYLLLSTGGQEHCVKEDSEVTSDFRGNQYHDRVMLSAVGVRGESGVSYASVCHPWARSSLKPPSSDIL